MTFKAHVRNGRILLDEPTDLPEGAEVELAPVEEPLGEDERRRLAQALAESDEDIKAGRVFAAEDVLDELRRG
ncbi:MAG TPA: hypothetical protein VFF06_05430 [Polyangia bacterium]|nr:hypothetical protein [Polyangia bacterium]